MESYEGPNKLIVDFSSDYIHCRWNFYVGVYECDKKICKKLIKNNFSEYFLFFTYGSKSFFLAIKFMNEIYNPGLKYFW